MKNTIKCPHCEREYSPSEIFLPKYFLGQETNIEKDYTGKIVYYDGVKQDLNESYTCDNCGKVFNVKAEIKYSTSIDITTDFSSPYISQLFKERLTLDEEKCLK